jgi:hypothetical protein
MSILANIRMAGVVLCGLGLFSGDVVGQDVGFTIKTGSLGYGGDLAVGLNEYVGLRAGYMTGDLEMKTSLQNAKVKGAIECSSIPLSLDLFPAGGSFRITLAGIVNNNKITMRGDSTEPIDLNGSSYWIQSLDGAIKFDTLSPYAGIGYGNAISKDGNFYFSLDLGVMFHGSPKATATAVSTSDAVQGALDSALEAELVDLNKDLKQFTMWPVLEIGFSYRF